MPTRKDNTNVAPIYREQVFIPASGTTLMKQNARPKINGIPVASGAIEIVSPEFDLLTGIRGLANMVKPKTYKSIINNTDYNPTISEIDNAVNQGIQMGRDYINHPIVQATSEHNRQLFKRLFGKPQNMIYLDNTGKKVLAKQRGELLSTSVEEPIKYKFAELPTNDAGTYIRSKDGSGNFTIKKGLDNSKTKLTAFHETLHHGRYGNFDGIIYDIKAEKLYPNNSYLMAGHEAAANTAEVGRDMGLALGQKYPGRQVFRDMLDNLLAKPYYKDFVIKDAKLDTNRDYKRLWDALTGKYFTTAGAAATGLNLTNNDKMKCGGRRKAQLGLDIREGGIAIPIANNMFYINGRKHAAGGVAIGPNNKNGVEVEGGEVVEMIDSNHPSVGRQFKAGGQKQTMRVFSSVPFLRGASPAELVLGGANPDVVFNAQEEFKDRNRINDDGTTYKTGGIHIKPSKRGTFTAAATKRGMSVQEFASKVLANKEDYSPAMVKKANFAKNASRWKKEYGGDMLYTINGNVKNGLSLRPKAQYGKQTIIRNNKEWEYDEKSGAFVPVKDVTKYKTIAGKTYKKEPNSKKYVEVTDSIEKIKVNQPKKQIVKQNKNSINKLTPINENKYTSVTKYNTGESYRINPITGEWIRNSITETSEPSVKGTTKVSVQSTSTPRKGETKPTTISRGTAKVESPKPATATNPMEARYASRVQKGQAQEVTAKPVTTYDEASDKNPDKNRYTRSAGFKAGETPAFPGNNQKEKDDNEKDKDIRLIGQYKTFRPEDWVGLGTNLAGHIASYFTNSALLSKYPMPIKPVMAQAAKFKTTHNINPELTNNREVELTNRGVVRRNTQSSNTSIAREQRIMNEARDARNKLYGEKENVETQLINLDKRNRQDIYNRNIAAFNDWLDKTYIAKTNKLLEKQKNMMSLINGIPSAVNHALGVIETRRNTNNTLRAIAAANPNVDARLIGGFDNYLGIGPDGKPIALYDKHQKLVRYI